MDFIPAREEDSVGEDYVSSAIVVHAEGFKRNILDFSNIEGTCGVVSNSDELSTKGSL